jgi:hypothetical protein
VPAGRAGVVRDDTGFVDIVAEALRADTAGASETLARPLVGPGLIAVPLARRLGDAVLMLGREVVVFGPDVPAVTLERLDGLPSLDRVKLGLQEGVVASFGGESEAVGVPLQGRRGGDPEAPSCFSEAEEVDRVGDAASGGTASAFTDFVVLGLLPGLAGLFACSSSMCVQSAGLPFCTDRARKAQHAAPYLTFHYVFSS